MNTSQDIDPDYQCIFCKHKIKINKNTKLECPRCKKDIFSKLRNPKKNANTLICE